MEEAYLGVDIGSISTKGVIIDKNYKILASEYIWTEGDPTCKTAKSANGYTMRQRQTLKMI